MKKYLFLFAVFFYFIGANAQNKINWMDLETAQKAMKKEPRKIIVDVYTDWCGWCKKMDVAAFGHPEIVRYVNENYYAVKLNAESTEDIVFKDVTYTNPNKGQRRATHEIAGIAAVNGRLSYPTIVYMDENLDLLQQIPGYLDAKGIEPIIHYFAEEAYKKTGWVEYQESFQSNIE